MSLALVARSRGVLRYSPWDGVLIGLSGVYAALLLWTPSAPLIAIGLWWTANTVAHNFIHTPFFRSRAANRAFSLYLSALMGFPQGLWRDRHLRHHREASAHHDGPPARKGPPHLAHWTTEIAVETGVIVGLWLTMVQASPWLFGTVYLPGYLAGLGLCQLQGYFEHAGGTTSHYGWLYNRLFFNDGYHVEHHRRPGEHWTRLPMSADPQAPRSRWPPVLRWLNVINLETLERMALRSTLLQRYMLASHERAFRKLLTNVPRARRVTIVGGGLFPRTALILRRLLPDASLSIVDAEREHLDIASRFFGQAGSEDPALPKHGGIELRHQFFDAAAKEDVDLVVVPLSFIGDRRAVYEDPPARTVLVHDWLWNSHAGGVRVSWLLLKRLNLVTR
jgi:Fatty acid desaturase